MAKPAISRGATPGTPVETREDKKDEYAVKATLLYHFFSLTTWPKEVDEKKGKKKKTPEPLTLLVVGKDPFGKHLDKTFKGKKINGRSVVITYSKALPKKLVSDMVFAGGMTDKERVSLIALATGKPLLLVGDTTGFGEKGAHCNLYFKGSNIAFEINADAVKASKLTISSSLLGLAKIVKTKKSKKDSKKAISAGGSR